MIDWKDYLESIYQKYAGWCDRYIITDVVSKNHDKQRENSLLFDLQAIALQPEALQPKRELLPEATARSLILKLEIELKP